MDVFYPELSYSKIQHQKAFTSASLLSEFGGIMGLLLGASALSICELLDFIVLSVMNKANSNKVNVKKINFGSKQDV